MKRTIQVTMHLDYGSYLCHGSNIYTYKNDEQLRCILIQEYFKLLNLRYSDVYINCNICYGTKDKLIEYTHEDFINDLIENYFKIKDEDNDLYFLILSKMETSKTLDEFMNYVRGLKEGLEWERGC